MKKFVLISILILTASICFAGLSSKHIVNYYSNTSGTVDYLQLEPKSQEPDDADCTEDNIGELYFYYTKAEGGTLYVCNATGSFQETAGSTDTIWKQEEVDLDTFLYPADTATNPDIKLGIGTETPDFQLQLEQVSGSSEPYSNGLLFEGTPGSGPSIVKEGAGSKFIWSPKESSLFIGNDPNNNVDDAFLGDHSISLGDNTVASANGSIAIGYQAISSGIYSIAIGPGDTNKTEATADHTIAIGTNSKATARDAIAISSQSNAIANGIGSIALGYSEIHSTHAVVATGATDTAGNINASSVAMGGITPISDCGEKGVCLAGRSTGNKGIAIGRGAIARGDNSIAIGGLFSGTLEAKSFNSVAFGSNNYVSFGENETGVVASDPVLYLGNSLAINGDNAFVVLKSGGVIFGGSHEVNSVTDDGVVIGGLGNEAANDDLAIGHNNTATGTNSSFAFGVSTDATGSNSFAMGINSRAEGQASYALGNNANVNAATQFSYAFGPDQYIDASHSFGFGWGTKIISGADYSIAFSLDNNTIKQEEMVNPHTFTIFKDPDLGTHPRAQLAIGTTAPIADVEVDILRLTPVASGGACSSSSQTGRMYYDSNTNRLRFCRAILGGNNWNNYLDN